MVESTCEQKTLSFDIVKRLWPWAKEEDYVRHPNGGGWKHKSCSVDESVRVPENAIIGPRASIGPGASIGSGAFIGPRASIGDYASIGDGAFIGNGASIGDGASIGIRASIGSGAFIGDGASIGEGASIGPLASIGEDASIGDGYKGSVLCIQASGHQITVCSPSDEVQIGCMRHPIAWWLKHFRAVGRKEGYTDQQIEEYGLLLAAVAQWIALTDDYDDYKDE